MTTDSPLCIIEAGENPIVRQILRTVFVSATLLASSSLNARAQTRQRTDEPNSLKPQENRISRAVTAAKQRGDASVDLPAPIVNDNGITSVSQVLANYTLLIAEPGEAVTVPERYGFLSTWQKLRIIETLSRQPRVDREPLDDQVVPSSLLPLQQREILLKMNGGSLSLNGVRVNQPSPVSLKPGKRYLLCLFLSNQGAAAVLASGSAGVFLVNDTSGLDPLGKAEAPLASDFRVRYRCRVDFMREDIRRRRESGVRE